MQQRYAIEFSNVLRGDQVASDRIAIVYWIESDGSTSGEAYFCRDDFCAPIRNGEFAHPYSGLRYKLHAPSCFGKSTDAVLDVLKWVNVDRATPVACPKVGEVTYIDRFADPRQPT